MDSPIFEVASEAEQARGLERLKELGIVLDGLTKHLEGQHDQSTHGRGKAGVPPHIDIEGKRFSLAAAQELSKRYSDYSSIRHEMVDKYCEKRFGKPWGKLSDYERDQARNRYRLNSEGDYVRNSDGSVKEFPSLIDEVDADPVVVAAKQNVRDHFLLKDALAEPSFNEDGTRGPATMLDADVYGVETMEEWTTRMISTSRFERDRGTFQSQDQAVLRENDGSIYQDENGKRVYRNETFTPEEAQAIYDKEWASYVENAEPSVIVSNKALRSILASGEFKNYTEADRPARAGSSGETYKNKRSTYENVAFGYTSDDPNNTRPISGTLVATDPVPDILNGYGGTRVILNRSVLPRTTVTEGDSLNTFGMPMTVGQHFASNSREYWYQVTSVAADVKTDGPGYFTSKRGQNYLPEIQVHGGVGVNDISRVVFQDKVPAALSSKLDKLGIPYEVIPTVTDPYTQQKVVVSG